MLNPCPYCGSTDNYGCSECETDPFPFVPSDLETDPNWDGR